MSDAAALFSLSQRSHTLRRAYVPPSPRSIFERGLAAAAHALDRSDERVKAWQDLALNVCLFAGAVWAMHRFGHKLAV